MAVRHYDDRFRRAREKIRDFGTPQQRHVTRYQQHPLEARDDSPADSDQRGRRLAVANNVLEHDDLLVVGGGLDAGVRCDDNDRLDLLYLQERAEHVLNITWASASREPGPSDG